MAHNYDFMFKFIIIGDSSTPLLNQVWEKAAYFSDSPRVGSKLIMSPLSECSSVLERWR